MNKSALELSYSEWLLEKFIPSYCERSKESRMEDGYVMLCIYICPHITFYKTTAEEWEKVHCARLAKNINSVVADIQKAEHEKYGEAACKNVNTLSLRIGNTREDRIEWLIGIAQEAKLFERVL